MRTLITILTLIAIGATYTFAQAGIDLEKWNARKIDKVTDLTLFSQSYTDRTKVKVKSGKHTYVNMAKYAPKIISAAYYSTKLNRTKKPVTDRDIIVLRKDMADKCIKINNYLLKHNLRLVIYDAYREYSASKKLYNYTLWGMKHGIYPQVKKWNLPNYSANPDKGTPKHASGAAIDYFLVDSKTNKPVKLPSAIDTFSSKAWVSKASSNKYYKIMRKALYKYKVSTISTEWYHVDLGRTSKSRLPKDNLKDLFYK